MTADNRQLVLVNRPRGAVLDSDFELKTSSVPEPGPGQFLVRVLWLSFDPTQRGWLNDLPSYMPPVQIGEVMRAIAVGQIVESRSPDYPVGTYVQGLFGWQDYVVADGRSGFPVTRVPDGVSPRTMLGVYGITGLTAYFGLLDVGRPAEDDLVVVSAAAGATGSVVGQIARVMGCRTIGIAGGPDKCAWVHDVARFDHVIDYKNDDVAARLDELAADGMDVYFDNVGGSILDVCLAHLALRARVVLCGGISSGYTGEPLAVGLRNYSQLVIRRARMEGFLLPDYFSRFGEGVTELRRWVASGAIVVAEDIQVGLENAPATLRRLFDGKNLGKQLLKVADPPVA